MTEAPLVPRSMQVRPVTLTFKQTYKARSSILLLNLNFDLRIQLVRNAFIFFPIPLRAKHNDGWINSTHTTLIPYHDWSYHKVNSYGISL